MGEQFYRVKVTFEDGSHSYMCNEEDEDWFTAEDVEGLSPLVAGVRGGTILYGRDADYACFTTLDVWQRILGYERKDFFLVTDIEVQPIEIQVIRVA